MSWGLYVLAAYGMLSMFVVFIYDVLARQEFGGNAIERGFEQLTSHSHKASKWRHRRRVLQVGWLVGGLVLMAFIVAFGGLERAAVEPSTPPSTQP